MNTGTPVTDKERAETEARRLVAALNAGNPDESGDALEALMVTPDLKAGIAELEKLNER